MEKEQCKLYSKMGLIEFHVTMRIDRIINQTINDFQTKKGLDVNIEDFMYGIYLDFRKEVASVEFYSPTEPLIIDISDVIKQVMTCQDIPDHLLDDRIEPIVKKWKREQTIHIRYYIHHCLKKMYYEAKDIDQDLEEAINDGVNRIKNAIG